MKDELYNSLEMVRLKFGRVVLTLLLLTGVLVLLTGCFETNSPPVASFTYSPSSGQSPLTVSFDASSSYASDGTIVTYAWNFGDESNGTGVTKHHTYTTTSNRTYTVTLTVTDNDGAQATTTHTVSVTPPPPNSPPVASFTAIPSSGNAPLSVSFDASSSYDSDGSITSYTWSFGDGESGSGVTATHNYTNAGTYTAQLTVMDDDRATDTTTVQIEVSVSLVPKDLYVDANSGSDTAGDGTQSNPYKTITKAAGVAAKDGGHHAIHVATGVYNTALGENFPISCRNINLVGEGASRDNVKLAGEVSFYDSCTITHVSIYSNVYLFPEQGSDNALVEDVYINAAGSVFPGGVQVRGQGQVTINNSFFDNGNIKMNGEQLIVKNCSFSSSDIEVFSGNVHIQNTTFTNSWVVIRGEALGTIRGNSFENRSRLSLIEEGRAIVENNSMEGRRSYNISVENSGVLDLGGGPLGSTGGNIITGAQDANLLDLRAPYSGQIYAKNNTWNDPQPTGTVNGPVDNPPNYYIKNEGNSIIFSDLEDG